MNRQPADAPSIETLPPSERPSSVLPALPPGPWTFNINSLLLLTTLVGICLCVATASPGIGVLFFLASAPAVYRAATIVRKRAVRGRSASLGDKIVLYLVSLLVVVSIVVFSCCAFFAVHVISIPAATATPSEHNWGLAILALIFSCGAGLIALIKMTRLLWPSSE